MLKVDIVTSSKILSNKVLAVFITEPESCSAWKCSNHWWQKSFEFWNLCGIFDKVFLAMTCLETSFYTVYWEQGEINWCSCESTSSWRDYKCFKCECLCNHLWIIFSHRFKNICFKLLSFIFNILIIYTI